MDMRDNNMVAEGARISVVDDDESMREAIKTLIGSMGSSVEEFSSAEDFLKSDQCDLCDCLILDIRMRGMSGLELQPRLSSPNPLLPIIFITTLYNHQHRSIST